MPQLIRVQTQPVYGVPRPNKQGQYPLDVVPASPSIWDDEFDGPTLSPKWINGTTSVSGGTNIVTFPYRAGEMKLEATGNNIRIKAIRQAAPPGDFSVMARMQPTPRNAGDIRTGVFVGITGGKGHVVGPSPQDSGTWTAIGVTTVSNTADWSGFDGYNSPTSGIWYPPGGWTRVRWRTASSTLFFDYSLDGATWTNWTSRGSMSQPDQMGIGIYAQGTGVAGGVYITAQWFRVSIP